LMEYSYGPGIDATRSCARYMLCVAAGTGSAWRGCSTTDQQQRGAEVVAPTARQPLTGTQHRLAVAVAVAQMVATEKTELVVLVLVLVLARHLAW
jgi:hypothetical protein